MSFNAFFILCVSVSVCDETVTRVTILSHSVTGHPIRSVCVCLCVCDSLIRRETQTPLRM